MNVQRLIRKIVLAVVAVIFIVSVNTSFVRAEEVTTVVMTYEDKSFSKQLYSVDVNKIKEGVTTEGLTSIGGLCDNLSFVTNGANVVDKNAVMEEVKNQIIAGKTSINIDLTNYTPEAVKQRVALAATQVSLVSGMANALASSGIEQTVTSGMEDPVVNSMLMAAGIDTMIAQSSTRFNANQDRAVNVRNAASRINGTILMPGQGFSANSAFGPRTTANGYGLGNVISGGKYVKAIGGGICQVSSTLNLAVLRAGIIPVERHNHSHRSTYIGSGLDATISAGTLDYQFVNTLAYPIYISTESDNGILTVSIYSNHDALAGITYSTNVVGGKLANTTYVVGTLNGVEVSNRKAYSSKYSQ